MALEVCGNAWEAARIIEPHVVRVLVVSPTDTGIRSARAKTDNWYVDAIFRGRGSWPHRWSVSSLKIHAQGMPSSWTKMRIERP